MRKLKLFDFVYYFGALFILLHQSKYNILTTLYENKSGKFNMSLILDLFSIKIIKYSSNNFINFLILQYKQVFLVFLF